MPNDQMVYNPITICCLNSTSGCKKISDSYKTGFGTGVTRLGRPHVSLLAYKCYFTVNQGESYGVGFTEMHIETQQLSDLQEKST